MMNLLGKIFGADKVIDKGLELIDDLYTSDEEEAEIKQKLIEAKTKAKTDLMVAYAPFKLAQRYIAFTFVIIFSFIMVNGVVGSLYGWIDIAQVEQAKEFADSMWLGEIMIAIVSFYFGGGFVESIKRNKK